MRASSALWPPFSSCEDSPCSAANGVGEPTSNRLAAWALWSLSSFARGRF